MDIKENITQFLNNGISAWTGEKNVRYPVRGNAVFLEILEKYRNLLNYEGITTFFEAGTFNGNNAADFSNVFDKVVTAEIDNAFYERSRLAHSTNKKIKFLHGDATTKLKEYLIENPHERMVILLDDHAGYQSFIIQELEVIREYSNVDHIIIVDDVDKLGLGTYPTREQIDETLSRYQYETEVIHDTERHKMLIFKPHNKLQKA